MASSSSSVDFYDNYDVFLSFRGHDTRNNFTSHLYRALCRNNINAFIDNKIDRGDEITPAIERVIEAVKLSIIVFSSDYASSTFCLDELVKIMECKESKSQIVLPIFYKVEPSEILYREAFAKHESVKQEMKVQRWKSFFRCRLNLPSKPSDRRYRETMERRKLAFQKALELAGWHIDDNSVQAEIIERITEEVLKKLDSCHLKGEELICTSIIGQTAEDNFNKIWEYLMNDKVSRVGIYGMGGIGKTTIANRVNNQLLEVANSFGHIYWVTVSKDSSIYKLQSAIARVINLDLSKEEDERKRAAKLQRQLIRRNFVLILDDVWESFEIEDVGIPLLVGKGKILLTTRSRRVCLMMKCQAVKIEHLSQPEAMDLFMKESEHQINGSREGRDIVHSIVRECAGLPLAIVVLARRMRGVEEIEEWRNTLRDLQRSSEGENHEMEEKVFKLLKFSYDRLPNNKYRQCFLYCSLFPEDYKFCRNDLIEYWISEGLIDDQDSRQAMLDKGKSIVNELINASLLEYERNFEGENRIKMHDVIRDMARINAKVGLQFKDPLESVQVIDETVLKSFSNSAPHCSKLRAVLLQNHYYKMVLPNSIFVNMQSLTILDMFRIKTIPDSVSNLENLRVLSICECRYLKYIPYLGGLEQLKHLKISDTGLREIPNGIERLVNLRVLNLSFNRNLRSIPSGVLETFSHLQTLDLENTLVEVEPEALISLKKLEKLTVDFYDLRKLNCYVRSGHWRSIAEYRIYYGLIEYRKFEASSPKYIEADKEWKRVMSIQGIRDVEWRKRESSIFLPDDIQYLRLTNMEIPVIDVFRNTIFADLQRIHISKYTRSKHIFTVSLARQVLRNVQKLHIHRCDGLKEIIATEEEDEEEEEDCVKKNDIVIPDMKKLSLRVLPELRSIYRGRVVCPSLEKVKIDSCDKLERLPFYMEEEGNQQNPTIKLRSFFGRPVSRRWWDSLQWDDPNPKSMYYLTERASSQFDQSETG